MTRIAAIVVVALLFASGAGGQPRHDLLTYAAVLPPDTGTFGSRICGITLDDGATVDLYDSSGDVATMSWSPDGALLAFEIYDPQTDERRVLIRRADGSFTGNVPPLGRHPSFAPDGRQLVYVLGGDLVVRDIHTWTWRRLTRGRSDSAPSWSPAGMTIAFTRHHDLFLIRSDGRGVRRLVEDAADPAWSPDGSQIAFTRRGGLWRVRADGRGARRVGHVASASSPAWSPDGSLIAYSGRGIMVVSPTGTGVRHAANGSFPAWRPQTAVPLTAGAVACGS